MSLPYLKSTPALKCTVVNYSECFVRPLKYFVSVSNLYFILPFGLTVLFFYVLFYLYSILLYYVIVHILRPNKLLEITDFFWKRIQPFSPQCVSMVGMERDVQTHVVSVVLPVTSLMAVACPVRQVSCCRSVQVGISLFWSNHSTKISIRTISLSQWLYCWWKCFL